MSYEGQVLRGEKFAVLYTVEEMKKLEAKGECVLADYNVFLESEKKVKSEKKGK